MNDHGGHLGPGLFASAPAVAGLVLAALAVAAYLYLATGDRRGWLRWRSACWVAGCLSGAVAVSGAVPHSFQGHMVGHLLLGMAAPVLLVLAAPVTLLLRRLSVPSARRLSRALRSLPLRVVTEPAVAAVLNVGALWLLYTTPLYGWQQQSPALQLLVHVHVLAAGCLFAVALIGPDPLPHRRSFTHRAVVLVAALAAHGILAKFLYAHPPVGVDPVAAQQAALVMYYGGDVVDVGLMVLLCAGWYRARATRASRPIVAADSL